MPHPDVKPENRRKRGINHHIKETSYMDTCNVFIYFQHIASGKSVKFYGVLENFSDNYDSKWNEEYAFGRMDPISVFQRTSRQISIGWKVISECNKIGYLNMRDISLLTNFLYPSYDSSTSTNVGTLSAAPLLRMKFVNLATNASTVELGTGAGEDGLVGYINGAFKVQPNINSGFLTPRSNILIPREVALNVNFTVLHTHRLGWSGSSTRTNAKFPYKAPPFTADVASERTLTNEDDDIPDEVSEGLEGKVVAGTVGTGTVTPKGSQGRTGGAEASPKSFGSPTNPDNQKERDEGARKTKGAKFEGLGSSVGTKSKDLADYEKEKI